MSLESIWSGWHWNREADIEEDEVDIAKLKRMTFNWEEEDLKSINREEADFPEIERKSGWGRSQFQIRMRTTSKLGNRMTSIQFRMRMTSESGKKIHAPARRNSKEVNQILYTWSWFNLRKSQGFFRWKLFIAQARVTEWIIEKKCLICQNQKWTSQMFTLPEGARSQNWRL